MLTTNISKNINGSSMINNKTVVSMHATISDTGNISMNQNIMDKDTYVANKAEVDADIAAFEEVVYKEGGIVNE